MTLTPAQLDRACGVLLGTAAGDALGAGYEFGPPLPDGTVVEMAGGGSFGWQPGEWTDDTAMAIAIAETAATGADLRTSEAQDQIVSRWEEWASTAKDVGSQTRHVLGQVAGGGAAAARAASESLHRATGKSAGNGALMRTAPVALAFLHDPDGLAEAARQLGALTHFDPEAGDACALWCQAIRHAVLTGDLDVRSGLHYLPGDRRALWLERLGEAERSRPANFTRNGWVVEALQAAWSAIATTPVPADDPVPGIFRADHLRLSLEHAVRGGRDTDTVAAIAGGLLGARWGASAVPAAWRLLLHGWPASAANDLVEMAGGIVRAGEADPFDVSYADREFRQPVVPHPYDDGLLLGDLSALRNLPAEVDAVVSLCRVGPQDAPKVADWLEVRLIDHNGADHNPHLDLVLHDTVTTIERLRSSGRTVLLHCVEARSRTPAVAALYGMRRRAVTPDQILAELRQVLPLANPIPDFRAALKRAAAPSDAGPGR
jgi:ADP-ribosylglycohydrolase/protein-tyrosine phosphatase